jgi:hypothetical protein
MSLEKWLRSLKNGLQGRRRNSARGGRVVAGKQFPDSLQIEILENRTLLSSVTGKVLTAAIEDFTTAGTIQDKTDNSPTVDQLDLKGIDGNLVVTLSKVSGAAKTNIQISRKARAESRILTSIQNQHLKISSGLTLPCPLRTCRSFNCPSLSHRCPESPARKPKTFGTSWRNISRVQ